MLLFTRGVGTFHPVASPIWKLAKNPVPQITHCHLNLTTRIECTFEVTT